jgi:hypothetical protein
VFDLGAAIQALRHHSPFSGSKNTKTITLSGVPFCLQAALLLRIAVYLALMWPRLSLPQQ